MFLIWFVAVKHHAKDNKKVKVYIQSVINFLINQSHAVIMKEQIICVVSFIIMLILVHESECHYNEKTRNVKRAGPQVYPTQGQPWPKPQLLKNYGTFMIVRATLFRFVV